MKLRPINGRPSHIVTSEPIAAYPTAAANSTGVIDQSTPENAMIVIEPFSTISTNESVEVVNVRTSSAIRWSGLSISPASRSRYGVAIPR